MSIVTINPATGQPLHTYEQMSQDQVLEVLDQSRQAYEAWQYQPISTRAGCLLKLAEVLRKNQAAYARLMSQEMGKPLTEALGEVQKCAWLCEVYADNAEVWLADEDVAVDGEKHQVVYQPLGVILSVMPWNYPFWQALRFAVPTLAAGNTSLLKHASNVTGCALAIEDAFTQAGFPKNVFRTVIADHQTVAHLIGCDAIKGVSLTGSTDVGRRIAELAGRHLKKVVLELGGSDPFIVLEDADVEFAAQGAVLGRMLCTGQSCIAAKRFIVMEEIAEAFIQRFSTLMSALVVGDPLDPKTQVGAMVNAQELATLQSQLDDAVALGATINTGGDVLPGDGFFFAPTVLSGTTPGMRVLSEEVFGPIAPVISVPDEAAAVNLANASPFGLGGSVWTRDLARGEQVARRLECGTAFVNSITKSDPRMPFGGIKQSGLGRELARFGLREFTNIKGINIYKHGA